MIRVLCSVALLTVWGCTVEPPIPLKSSLAITAAASVPSLAFDDLGADLENSGEPRSDADDDPFGSCGGCGCWSP